MKYLSIPFVPQPVSRVVLGGSGKRFAAGEDISDLMEAALECGINTVDTARVYGSSEQALGRWLCSAGRREKIVIISKCCHPSMAFHSRVNRQAAADDLARSLDTLDTDHIDIYLLHRDNESVAVGAIVEFLNQFHQEGRIGAFGGSNWTAKRIAEANAYASAHGLIGFSVSSPHDSLGRQRHDPWGNGCKSITGERHSEERAFYQQQQLPVLAWSSLCNGVFSGKLHSDEWRKLPKLFGLRTWWGYSCPDNRERLARCQRLAKEKGVSVSQIALAWLLAVPYPTLPVISASSPRRIIENAAAAELELSDSERAYLNLQAP